MNARNIRHLVVLFVMSILSVTSAAAQEQFAAQDQGAVVRAAKDPTKPIIHRATVDSATNQITVEGINFGDTPIVEIEGVILTLVSNTPTHLVAQLPPGLPPASYLLKVIADSNPDSKKKVLFEVTIGAVGPQGPQGPAGSGTVTSVSAAGPLAVANGATTPRITLSGVVPIANGGTGSSIPSFVNLTTAQAVGGSKTFTDQVVASGGIALLDRPIRLRADDSHTIRWSEGINGIRFTTVRDYVWQLSTGTVQMVMFQNGNLTIRGNYNQFSDARYKTNVQTFGNALDMLRRLRGVTFDWKPELNKG